MTPAGAALDTLKAFFLDRTAARRRPGDRPGLPYAKALAVGALVFLLTALRKPSSVLIPQFWADDGFAFFAQAREFGPGSFLIAHGGYYHAVIRLAALLGVGVPVPFAPHYYLAVSVAVLLFTVSYLYSPRLNLRYPTLMALCLALAPHGGEVPLVLCNTNFYFGLVLALFLISDPPTSRWQHARDALMIVLVGLSGAFSLIYLPLFVWRAVRERGVPAIKVRAFLIGAVAVLQLVQVLAARLAAKEFRMDPRDVLNILGIRVLSPLLTGPAGGLPTYSWLLGIYTVALLAFLVWAFRRERNHKALYLLAAGMSVVGAALYIFRGVPENLYTAQDRFFFVPLVVLLWCLVQALGTEGWVRPFAAVLLFVCAVRTVGQPSNGLFIMRDRRWAEASRCIGGPVPCKVPINPPGWYVPYRPALAPRERDPSPEPGRGSRSSPDAADHVPEQEGK